MKKYVFLLIITLGIGLGSYFVKAGTINQEAEIGSSYNLTRKKCQTATTTPDYLATATATSTCQVFIGDASAVDFRFMVNSTSTPATLTYSYSVTEDDTLATRNWFLVDGSYDANTLATSTTEMIPYYSFHKSGLSASYLRLNYKINGAADVYVEIIPQNKID